MSTSRIFEDIDRSLSLAGLHILGIIDETTGSPLFVYTVGMTKFKLPEVITFGVSHELVAPAINTYFRELARGLDPGPRVVTDWFSHPMHIVEASPSLVRPYAAQAYSYAEHKGWSLPRFVQWVWPDHKGRFPWEIGFDSKVATVQPLLRKID